MEETDAIIHMDTVILYRKARSIEEKKRDAHEFQIAVTGSVAKCCLNPERKACLPGTGDQILMEVGHYDGIWGVKPGIEETKS